jgi:hypothetical protein
MKRPYYCERNRQLPCALPACTCGAPGLLVGPDGTPIKAPTTFGDGIDGLPFFTKGAEGGTYSNMLSDTPPFNLQSAARRFEELKRSMFPVSRFDDGQGDNGQPVIEVGAPIDRPADSTFEVVVDETLAPGDWYVRQRK